MSANPRTATAEEHLEKAQHNYCWANHLFTAKPENLKPAFDWAATVSYYSAVHFFLFHLAKTKPAIKWNLKQHHIRTLTDFINKFSFPGSKHSAYLEIVKSNFPQIETEWRHLFNTAHTARYSVQLVQPLKAKLSIECLNEVKKVFT